MKKEKAIPIVLILLASLFSGVLLYPFFMDAIARAKGAHTIIGTEAAEELESNLEIEWRRADNYNRMVYENQSNGIRMDQNTDDLYGSVLNISNDGIMGYLDIPEINLVIPIGHGTDSNLLSYAAGHLYGTSVPSGGESTHSVITAHTGLESAKLFSDIDRLKEGSVFYLNILDETHKYEVDQIETVLPNETDPYLKVENGHDYITLYTCTPYGVNTHRLLVRGRRVPSDHDFEEEMSDVPKVFKKAVAETVLLGSIPPLVLIAGLLILHKKRKKI